jgi:hypothetical protein
MRRLKFNFINISCVIYKAHSTPFGKCYPELNHAGVGQLAGTLGVWPTPPPLASRWRSVDRLKSQIRIVEVGKQIPSTNLRLQSLGFRISFLFRISIFQFRLSAGSLLLTRLTIRKYSNLLTSRRYSQTGAQARIDRGDPSGAVGCQGAVRDGAVAPAEAGDKRVPAAQSLVAIYALHEPHEAVGFLLGV